MTIEELRRELAIQARDVPDLAALRAEVDALGAARFRRRRVTALIAAAAAVVLVAGGAAVAGSVLGGNASGPASPAPVVSVRDISLPPGTALIRHQLDAVSTPVTAGAVPAYFDLTEWIQGPGLLSVSFFDRNPGAHPGAAGDVTSGLTGYTITAEQDEPLRAPGGGPVTTTDSTITVGGHPAILQVPADGALDPANRLANRFITWQLSDGGWIHVFGDDDLASLMTFADGIVQRPNTLNRSIGIGVTVAGLTEDSSANMSAIILGFPDPMLYLCPPGTAPIADDSAAKTCLTVQVSAALPADVQRPVAVSTASTVVQVDAATRRAWTTLADGNVAVVTGPASPRLSVTDLATAAASVRLAPELSATTAAATSDPGTGISLPGAPVSASTSTVRPSITTQPNPSSTVAATEPPSEVLGRYLRLLKTGDCTAAGKLFRGQGNLCGAVTVSDFSEPGTPAMPSSDRAIYPITLTTSGSKDGTIPAGAVTWYFTLHRQSTGNWLITGGGSGP